MLDWGEMSPWERDALVAEEVMGMDLTLVAKEGHDFPRFTTDIKAAWRIIDQLDEEDELRPFAEEVHERLAVIADTGLGCEANFTANLFRLLTPDLVCRCALRAKGVDV